MRAAIYHYTNKSEIRPIVYEKELSRLQSFAVSKGFSVKEIFCDKSLRLSERTEFNRFLSCCDKFDALITKDFHHIKKNTMACMTIMKSLLDKGIKTLSIENGYFTWEEIPYKEPLRAVTYCCQFGTPNEMKAIIPVKNDIFKLFTDKKTNWKIIDQYFDKSKKQADGEQVNLMELIQNKAKYDILLVHNLNDLHWRTANFCKIRNILRLDIYSLQDGFLKFTEETDF